MPRNLTFAWRWTPALFLGAGALLLTAARLRFAATEPLWFDESFSLAIISRPDWATFWREVYLDSNGPGYYLLLRLWSEVFGTSNLALRVPSLLAVLAAAALPLLARARTLDREAALTWAALIFAWWGVGFFLDARCYAVLLAVATLQCLTFARLMERPGRRRAVAWAAVAAAAILLHYYAVFLGLAQGLIYLARHRWAAVRTWPAALAFVPAFGWMAYHGPRLAEFSRLAGRWHPPLDVGQGLGLAAFAFGPSAPLTLAAAVAILLVGWLSAHAPAATASKAQPDDGDAPDQDAGGKPFHTLPHPALGLTAVAGALAFVLMITFALLGSGISPRYLVPVGPPLLLGLVLLARGSPGPRLTRLALVALYLGLQVRPALDALSPPRPLPRYEFETAAAWLMDHQVSDVVFLWDHELAPIMAPTTLARVGGVFFERAGRPVRVTPLVEQPGQDPNLDLGTAARGARPGFVWLYNRQGHTAAHDFAPAFASRHPGWRCRQGPASSVGVLACYRASDDH